MFLVGKIQYQNLLFFPLLKAKKLLISFPKKNLEKTLLFSLSLSVLLSKSLCDLTFLFGRECNKILHMKSLHKLVLFIAFTLVYALFEYLPIEHWIENELVFLIVRISFFIVFSGLIIFFKLKYKIEIERPKIQISYLWLTPLLIPCFTNFYAVAILNGGNFSVAEGTEILILDLVADLFASILEDLLFIDLAISYLYDLFPQWSKKKRHLYILIAALFFTLIHSYSFLYQELPVAIIQMVSVFYLSCVCGYLAIFFRSEIIPIIAHFFFNAINFVTFSHFYELNLSKEYFELVTLILLFTIPYVIALYYMSHLKKYQVMVEEKEKNENQNEE